jgi:hypothetical protein
MKSFSQRKGLKPVKSVMQVESMDDELRNGLWNALSLHYWDLIKPLDYGYLLSGYPNMNILFRLLWIYYFKKTLDSLDNYWPKTYEKLRQYFFSCQWNEVYDFIEFVAKSYPNEPANRKFKDYCNSILELELSAYRFVGPEMTRITSEEEIAEIEKALKAPLRPVTDHLKRALDLFADRKSPDYRNSIKESISAVEAICQLISGDAKAPLGQTLKVIKDKVGLHPALEKAFSCLYGYTSDAEGIRHALLEEPTLNFEDAKFMLVSCSAFINYLITKSSKAGIKL